MFLQDGNVKYVISAECLNFFHRHEIGSMWSAVLLLMCANKLHVLSM